MSERGLPFSLATEFDWNSAIRERSDRYSEHRTIAVGLIRNRVHVLIYTMRLDVLRVISLRRANTREIKRYEEAKSLLDRQRQS